MHVVCIPTDVGCFLGQKANLEKKTCRKCNNLDAVMGHGLQVPPRNHAHLMKIIVFKTDSSQNKNHFFQPQTVWIRPESTSGCRSGRASTGCMLVPEKAVGK